jgi:ribosome-binding ATPase
MLSVGLVGLPNAGKSTLFNLLTKKAVPAANFPFCTIDPHDGIVTVPDERVDTLASLNNSNKTIHAAIEFRDIAGLVKNAHQGAGLGNQFLSHIREVDLILLVVRAFENDDIIHVENRVNPTEDEDILLMELTMADSNLLEKTITRLEKDLKTTKDKFVTQKLQLAQKLLTSVNEINLASSVLNEAGSDNEVIKWRKSLNLLTDKPLLRLANVNIDGKNQIYKADFELDIASELAVVDLDPSDREELGLNKESGIDKLITQCYTKLNLATYLTCGPQESRAWTFTIGDNAPVCASKIHSDFEKKFIKAEVITYNDFISLKSRKEVIANGKMQTVGKDYIMKDGDIVEFILNQ